MAERRRLREITVFLSSPGDVAVERTLVREIAAELSAEPYIRDRAIVVVVSWDDPLAPTPMLADRTPQDSVSRARKRPSKCDIVVVVLWSRLGTKLPDEHKKADGSSYASGTEWEYEDALRAEPRPVILVYQRTERVFLDSDDPEVSHKLAQRERVKLFFSRFRDADGSLTGGISKYASPSEFADLFKKNLREVVAGNLGLAPSSDGTGVGSWQGSPYPGLRPFTSDEAAVFFGRGPEVDALVARLRDPAQRFLAVIGASGSGKSSLVQAGLLPRLAGGAIEGSEHWPVLAFTPGAMGSDPFLAVAAKLDNLLTPSTRLPPAKVAQALAGAPDGLLKHAGRILSGRPPGSRLVIFVDQLEELFTSADEQNRAAFVSLLVASAGDTRLQVLATLRSDFLPQCAAEPTLAQLLQSGTFVLGPPGPASLADMIRRPAELAALPLEQDLTDALLRDAGGDPGEALPLVAFCLEELYRRVTPSGHSLSVSAYREMGGLRGAVGRRVSEILVKVGQVEGAEANAALHQTFRALVHVDAVGRVTRQRANRDALMGTSERVTRLIEALIQGHLLLAEDTGGRPTVVLAHETLLQEWPALRDWLEEHRTHMERVQRQLMGLSALEPQDRKRSAEALGSMGRAAPEAVPALVARLADAEAFVRRAAAEALGRIGPESPEIVPALVGRVSDAEASVRRAAAEALGRIGPALPEVVPALTGCLSDTEAFVRRAAIESLGRIGPALPEVVPALVGCLADAEALVRRAAAWALGEIGPTAAGAVPALAGRVGDVEAGVRRMAALTLGRIGPAAVTAVPALIEVLSRDTEARVRRMAIFALGAMGPVRPDVAVALGKALGDADEVVRKTAAEALQRTQALAT